MFRLNRISWLASISVLSMLFSLTLSPVAALNSVNILPQGGKPYGLTYAEHIKNFWKWNLAIPAKDNPINDPTGDKCATGIVVNFANNGIFGILQGGPTNDVADGFYILTQPLAKGPIHFKSSLICTQPDCDTPNFAQDITYTIIAQ